MQTTKTGYINGSDLLLFVGGKAVGHCTTHTTTFNSETKDRAVKPAASAPISAGLWKAKGVTGLAVSISAEGLRHYEEAESGLATLLAAWKTGAPVEVKCIERENDTTPYLSGSFVITSLEEGAVSQDDATYSISLENSGEVTVTESALTKGTTAS